jgi:AbrB family looped-hinge helix DNA binding protein
MLSAQVSGRGQITLPAAARRKLGIEPNSRVVIEVRETEIAIRLLKSALSIGGIFSAYVKGKSVDWEIVRSETEQAVAEDVVNEGKR